MIFIACSYSGQINYGMNNMPMYVGGVTTPLMISESYSYYDLVMELHRVTEIDPREYRLKIICNWPIAIDRTSAVEISNDYHMSIMFKLGMSQQTVELFIEKLPHNSCQIFKPPGEFSRMLDMGVHSDGFLSSSNEMERAQFGGTLNVMNNEVSYGNMGRLSGATIEEDEISNDSGGEEQYSAPVDSMQFVTQDVEDNPEWPDEAYVNNDYVEYEEPPPDEFEDDEWIRSSTVKDMCIGESSTRRGDDDAPFKVGDLFETKDQLVDAIREYSFEKNFKFKQVKSNRTSYDAICFMNTQRTGLTEGNEADYSCPWKLYAFAGKKHNFQFRISEYCGVHTCVNPILEQDHSGASASYIARLIMPKLRKKLDLTPDNIIEKVLDTKFIKISYIKAWNARRIAMTKIFGD